MEKQNKEMDTINVAKTAKNIQDGRDRMTDLVFNPASGEFEQRGKEEVGDGDVVTRMAETGFACRYEA